MSHPLQETVIQVLSTMTAVVAIALVVMIWPELRRFVRRWSQDV